MSKIKSKIFTTILILVMIMIIGVGTYALTVWSSKENTELTIRIGDIEGLTCLKENDINVTDIGPVFDYEEDGEITEFTVLNNTSNLTLMTGTLKINNITEDIQNEDFKYVVQYSEDRKTYENISEGNFNNVQNGDEIEIFKEKEIESKGFFKVIFYLDGNSENPIELQGGSLESELTFCTNTVLKVSATDVDLRLPGTKNVTYEYYGDGTLSCSSSNTSIVTCSVDTVNNRVVLTSVAEGTAVVSLISTEGSYHAAVTKEMNITVDSGKYTITLNKNCGTASSMNIYAQDISGVYLDETYTTKMTTTTNPVTPPTCVGYAFKGYYTATTGGTQMLSSNGYITSNFNPFSYEEDVDFYGQWNPNTYNITYVMNDGTVGSNAPTSATYDTVIKISNPTRSDGYEFTGWTFNGDTSTAKHGSSESAVTTAWSSTGTSVKSEYFKNLTPTNGATVTMTANFKKELTATFKYYNNKTITKKCTLTNTATSCNITAPTATELAASGYTLRGLSTSDAANATTSLAAAATLTLTSDVTYYASYQMDQTATFYYSDLTVDNLVYSDPQVSATATATKYMNYAGTNIHSNYTIPTVVTSSTGGGAAPNYQGIATSVNSATTITTPTTANTAFYAVYNEDLTFYYYTGSAHTNTPMYRLMLSNGTNYVTSLSATEPTPASTYDGVPLKGWTYTPSVINNVTPLSTVENKLYSYWQKDVTLTYNSNGCGTAPSTQSTTKTYISNNEMVELTNTLTVTTGPANCAGQSFVEWNTASDGSGTSYDPGDTMTMDSSKTLYAIWDGPTYTITYDYDGGSVSSANPTTYNVSTATFTLNNPTYEHYLFNSWTEELSTSNWYSGFINIDSGAIETSNASYPNSVYSEMIYLESGVTYTISGTNLGGIRWRYYNTNGTYIGNVSSTETYTPTQNGYVRVLLYEGCTEANRNAMKITSSQGATVQIAQGSTGNRKYIASKTERNYTIDFNCNNGTNPPSSVTKPYGTTVTLPTNTCTREGYSFLGWSVSHEATSATYGDGNSYTVNATATLYAVWEITTYQISYDANDGSGAPSAQTKTYGTALTLSSTTPTRTGYTFVNWNTAADGSGTSYAAGASYTTEATATLYAQWDIITYSVSYNCNGGTGTAPASQTKEYGTALTLRSNTCTNTGYSFSGWNTASNGTGTNYAAGGSYTSESSTTLYANWSVNKVSIDFSTNGGVIQEQTTASDGTVHNWDINNSWPGTYGVYPHINRTTNGVTTSTFNIIYYNSTLTSSGLVDWNDTTYMNITRTGYKAKTGYEWICLDGPCLITGEVTQYGEYVCELNGYHGLYIDDVINVCRQEARTYVDEYKEDSTITFVCQLTGRTFSSYRSAVSNCESFAIDMVESDSDVEYQCEENGYTSNDMNDVYENCTAGLEYNQNIAYEASDFCNIENKSCVVLLGVNWEKLTYPVNYDCNGGTGTPPASQTKKYGTALTLRSNTCTKSGYTFKGWATTASATSATYVAGGSYTTNAAATLYAVWRKYNAADTIMTLASTDACAADGTGVCATNSNQDYRYRGAEVDNWVSFNNDMYRIIGVFDENSHGVEGQQLVKLIAANPLMSTAYGIYNSSATSGTYSSYKNDWTGNTTGVKANANVLLNEYFYGKTNTSNTYGACNTWTYYYSNTNYRTNDCSDIVGYGINNTLQNYIEEVTWYLKGYINNNYSKQNFYLCERGQSTDTTNCMSGNSGAYDASTTGKIGLMYLSDYMYASSYYADTDTTYGSQLYYGNKNWLYKGLEWTITPDADSANIAFNVMASGFVSSYTAYYGLAVRPSFYLKSNVSITGGKGTFDSPFTLSI